jgi:23S rRNA pseudouridine1911/1915/1917 synthase
VSGVVVFARTSKALTRLNEMFRLGKVAKTYHAIVGQRPAAEAATLTHWLTRNERQNKAYAHSKEVAGSKKAVLDYELLASSERYHLLQVNLHTGRHHQIRCQLAAMGCCIKGDLKYGAPRSNPDGSISLHARKVAFEHPVSHKQIEVEAPYPENSTLWQIF